MKTLLTVALMILISQSSSAACTDLVKIERLSPRVEGWVHIKAEGVSDMDIYNCGQHDESGMLLNFNDTSGTAIGKRMLYSTLLTAIAAGKRLRLCSSSCDTQHAPFTELNYINDFQ
jgi:hypothetical protein